MAGYLKAYKSYVFRDKDPVIDKLRTIVADSGMNSTEVSTDSGVSASAIFGWFHGKTRRPQFATVNAVARACGQELVFKKFSK